MKKEKVEILPAVTEDAAAMAVVYCAAWKNAYQDIFQKDLLNNMDVYDWAVRFKNAIEENKNQIILAKNDQTVVGLTEIYPLDPINLKAEIRCIYVHPEYGRKGIGTLLISYSVNALKALGAKSIFLWSHPKNYAAASFYKKMGFSLLQDKSSMIVAGEKHLLDKYFKDL